MLKYSVALLIQYKGCWIYQLKMRFGFLIITVLNGNIYRYMFTVFLQFFGQPHLPFFFLLFFFM